MRPDLGFTEIDKRVVSDYIDYYDYSYIYIIENILEFSDDIIKDESGNALGLLVQKHLFEIAYSKKN